MELRNVEEQGRDEHMLEGYPTTEQWWKGRQDHYPTFAVQTAAIH